MKRDKNIGKGSYPDVRGGPEAEYMDAYGLVLELLNGRDAISSAMFVLILSEVN